MFTYFIILCLIIGVRNNSDDEQISVNSIDINMTPAPPTIGQISLAIIFDCTGSMQDNLKEMKAGAKRLVDTITERPDNPIYNYIFVCFRDPDIDSAFVTTEKQVLMEKLNNVTVDGGDDCPEMTMRGILEGMKYVLDKSYVYVFTDATSKDNERADEVLDLIMKKQTTVSFFFTEGCASEESAFKELAMHSNGEFYDLNTKDIGKVLDDLKDTIDKRLIILKYINELEGKNNSINLIVDSGVEQLFISVAGRNSVIEMFDPDNQQINATNLLALDNLRKARVDRPNNGNWSILVGATTPHTIKITGISNLTFTYGFSLNLTEKIDNTVSMPIKDVENVLIVWPSDSNLITNLTSVSMTSSNESLTLILERMNESISYATEPFPVFKIQIFGFDKHEKQLERLISTSIEVKEKSPPLIEIAMKKLILKEGDDFSIKCDVRSALPISVKWMKDNDVLLADEFDQSESLEYNIKNANQSNAGEYICSAENENGISEDIVEVSFELSVNEESTESSSTISNTESTSETEEETTVTTEYEDVSEETCSDKENPILNTERITKAVRHSERGELEIKRFDQFNLICPFENYQTIIWYKNGNLIKKTETTDYGNYENDALNFNHSMYHDRGEYVCTAENSFGQNNYTYRINIVWPPKILYPSYNNIRNGKLVGVIRVHLNQDFILNCIVDGNPQPQIMWVKPDNTIAMEKHLHIGKVTVEKQGNYRCITLNDYGHDEKSYDLEIIRTPPKKNNNVQTRRRVLEGSYMILDCNIEGYPDVSYTWYHNGKFVQNNSQYLIKIVKAEDKGWYTCLAINEMGWEENAFAIQVFNLPTITYINASTTINDFDDLSLECIAKGIPLPFISWQLNDKEVVAPTNDIYQKYQSGQSGQYSIPMMHGVGVLTLYHNNEISLKIIYSKHTRKNAGKYVCSVASFSGRDEKSVEIGLHPSPLLRPDIYQTELVNAMEGKRLILQCPNHRNTTLSYLWRKNKKNIRSTNRHGYLTRTGQHLVILRANLNDAGIYECFSYKQHYIEKQLYNVSIERKERFKRIYPDETAKPPSFINPVNEFFTKSTGVYVHLNCLAIGWPSPIITWFKGDESIAVLPNYENFKLSDDKKILKIFLNDSASFGKYFCKAENQYDVIEKHFEVMRYEKVIWSEWSPCSTSCGKGYQFRQRDCFESNDHCKEQPKIEYRECEVVPCDDYYFGSGSGLTDPIEYDESPISCGNGYEIRNSTCQDVNECHNPITKCEDDKHTCLNTNGSYECLPTECLPQYSLTKIEKRHPHEVIKDCTKYCYNFNSNCSTKAIVAETIQYSVLSLPKVPKLNEPIKKIVSYNINGRPLKHTEYRLVNSATNTFYLKSTPHSKAISYLYTGKILRKEQVYKIELVSRSFHYEEADAKDNELLYNTRYYIYIYIM